MNDEICMEGRCGEGIGKCPEGQCCSKNGYCGTTSEFCTLSQGCQKEYGDCKKGKKVVVMTRKVEYCKVKQ